jgi:hypothetical protein
VHGHVVAVLITSNNEQIALIDYEILGNVDAAVKSETSGDYCTAFVALV